MTTWLNALRDLHSNATAAVLVTVAAIQGSTPREAGARMVYTGTQQFDTIGGGHLEWRAAQIARAMLAADPALLSSTRKLERIALGPSLGQCCGGVVFLAFERIDPVADTSVAVMLDNLEQHRRSGHDVWRAIPLEALQQPLLLEPEGDHLPALPSVDEQLLRQGTTQLVRDSSGKQWLLDRCRAQLPQVVLFGAGHVGAAIVQVLNTLPCRLIWVDAREEMFPQNLPAHITVEATDVPNAVVDQADPGAYYLVMTHSHALDQQLTERILLRPDIGWFGLIGSRTKRQQFEHRLLERGITQEQLNRMTCPIGIPGIYGKEPASIAIAVVAQLVQLWECRQSQPYPAKSGTRLTTQALDGRH
ncbi:xanthine dehydrogenase accessory factor [Herbaspirillum sp. Sphag1AN]|uniref:xanthine dehydrogenase accessory protein XdhC n=1 Tax=unclassified Herbaspirillum TaxID=2624150 RepID=UPI0016218011|nr:MULTISPECIES: xanthine dehydrogenase accessory protein XdhC [unclassified Herbaspirillum]MBB3211237.1 xanthine dehydrogenase accessory factor [Herbaspirillum sp. Sphag1AN]MBB3244866.1 xanthine dehydrogenase accessory factor [Herbaspirillum sp. Sphag64]